MTQVIKENKAYQLIFKGASFVLKLSGKVLKEPYLTKITDQIAALQSLDVKIVLVFGFGEQADELTKKIFGKNPTKIQGRRVTTEDDLKACTYACGSLLLELCAKLQAKNIKHQALVASGHPVIKVKKRKPEPIDYGQVGDVQSVDAFALKDLLYHRQLLIIPTLVCDRQGTLLNVNADVLAAKIAASIGADKLIFISDVRGLLDGQGQLMEEVKLSEIKDLIDQQVIKDGMLVKIHAASTALKEGVKKVHIISGLSDTSIKEELFSKKGSGTVILQEDKSYLY